MSKDAIYGAAAEKYWKRGWRGGIPITPETKKPALCGVTGHNGIDLSYADVLQLAEMMPGHNIALRLPDNEVCAVIGIDVDHYDEKRGGDTLAHAESLWGALPSGARSTSRTDDPISGIRLFRVPPGLHWESIIEFPDLGLGDIEIIQRSHRTVVCWPSVHPSGRTYQWIDTSGNIIEIPAPEDLPELPDAWVKALSKPLTRPLRGDQAPCDVDAYRTPGTPEGRVKHILNRALDALNGPDRFDHTRDSVLALLRCGKDGDPGVDYALTLLGDEYVSVIGLSGARSYKVARIEYDRTITNPGAALLLSTPSHTDPFAHYTQEPTMRRTNTSAEAAKAAEAPEEPNTNGSSTSAKAAKAAKPNARNTSQKTSAASAASAEAGGDPNDGDSTDTSAASAASAEAGGDPNDGDSDTSAASAASAEAEGDPIPLTTGTVDMPPFPIDALPTAIADMVEELAEATQTDPAMAGTSALAVLAACAGGHANIEIRRGWVEPLCLFIGTIARPGERKSAVISAMTRPLNTAEAEMGFAGQVERLARQDELDMAKKKAEKLATAAATAAAAVAKAKPEEREEKQKEADAAEQLALDAAAEARAITVPTVPRLLADDITPEATGSLLAENDGRIAIISAEGGLFDILAGRYTKGVNLDPFLKGHAGDAIRVDRKGRPPEHIPSPALTIGLMFQPRVLDAIASNRDFAGRGLLARFLYARPVSKVGNRTIAADPVDKMTESNYNTTILKLASEMSKWVGDPAILNLSPGAQEEMKQIERRIEPQLAGDGALATQPTLIEWASKYVGAVGRIAGLLHLAEHGESGIRMPLQDSTIRNAAKIGEYYKAAAINVFTEMFTDDDTADAIYLLDKVRSLGAEVVSQRDLFTAASRSRFPTSQSMLPALRRLIDHGWLIQKPPGAPTGGRPASPTYKVVAEGAEAAQRKQHNTQQEGTSE